MSTSESSGMWRIERYSTVYMEWKIPKFFDLAYGNGEKLDSPSFSLSGSEWFIRIYPNHNNSIFLRLKTKTSRTVSVTFTMGIKEGNDSVFTLFKNETDYWTSRAFPRSDLSTLKDTVLIDDALTVFLQMRVPDKTLDIFTAEVACQTHSDGFGALSRDFKELYLNKSDGDINFKVKQREILAHKLVLTTRSTVFDRMFKADMLEKNDGIVNISDSDPDHFEIFLLHLYSGELNGVTSDNAVGLYMLADKYSVKELKEACCECLIREIRIDNFCDVVVLASVHSETVLLEKANEFFLKHANVIIPTPMWAAFHVEHATVAIELVAKLASKFIK